MNDFKPRSVIGRYVGTCPKCGTEDAAVIIDELPLLPDGRVDMESKPGPSRQSNCLICQARENKQAKQQNRKLRQQKKWRDGKGKLAEPLPVKAGAKP